MGFAVSAHAIDVATTYWRDPSLLNEGNILYGWLLRLGFGGWAWIFVGKICFISVGALGYAWYLRKRADFLPPEPQPTAWHVLSFLLCGEYVPLARYLLRWTTTRREFRVIPLAVAAMWLPASGVWVLYLSLENADTALHPNTPVIPYAAQNVVLWIVGIGAFAWFLWAWMRYYRQGVVHGAQGSE